MLTGDEKGQEMQLKNAEKKTAIAKQLSDTELSLPDLDLEVRVETGFKLPLDMIPSLGVAFASMPECVRTVVGNVSVPTLLQATYENGAPLDPSLLQKFNNGSGLLGSFRDVEKGFGQAHFHVADSGAITTTAVAPYDPTMLFMAMALSQINKKLDTIQETQEEMLDKFIETYGLTKQAETYDPSRKPVHNPPKKGDEGILNKPPASPSQKQTHKPGLIVQNSTDPENDPYSLFSLIGSI